MPLTDNLLFRWQVAWPALFAASSSLFLLLAMALGIGGGLAWTGGLVLTWLGAAKIHCRRAVGMVEFSMPHTATVVFDVDRYAALFGIYACCSLAIRLLLPDHRPFGSAPIWISIIGFFGLQATFTVAGYLRREFFDILPDRIVHRKFPLIGEPEIKTIRYAFATVRREKNKLRIAQSTSLEIVVPLARLDRPLRFLAAVEAATETSFTRHAEDARAAPAAERET